MGNFNPHRPIILGMEMVPIQQNLRNLDIGTEIGYGFTVTGAPANTVNTTQPLLYWPNSSLAGKTILYNFYPRGREDDTGEINVVRFTLSNALVTGATVSGASAFAALARTDDNQYVEFDSTTDRLRVNFDAPFALTGARILGVELVYQAAGTPGFVLEPTIESNTAIYPYGPYITGPSSLSQVSELGRVRLGEVNAWWTTASQPTTESSRMPWRYADMSRWSNAGSGAQLYFGVRVNTLPLSGFARLGYLAVDVYYCDESRVGYGGIAYGQDPAGLLTMSALTAGPTIRNTSFTNPLTLTSGDYTMTVTQADAGDKYNAGDSLSLSQLYLYQGVSSHPTMEITKFRKAFGARPAIAPAADDTSFMVAGVPISTGPIALQAGEAPVPYVTVEGAPVYGVVNAVQQAHNRAQAPGTVYTQLRFYARRFNPTAAGNLTITAPSSSGVTITPEQFAELPELTIGENGPGTGWREVTVPYAIILSNDSSFTNVTWSASGVINPIDQWQILVTRVFSYYSVDGKTQVSATPNTHYQKSRYDGFQNASLTWKAPEVIGATTATDSLSTLVFMFSQDFPEVTDLSASLTSMAVSGIGEGCAPDSCIADEIYGVDLDWSVMPVSGSFDYYEIQREDDRTDDFETIATISNRLTTTFTDWEARTGMESRYRIRAVNELRFASPWSTEAAFTLPAPGVGGAGNGNSVLIFTSNIAPTGSLAYIMQWEGEPVEEFTFPEAETQELQRKFGKDYFTAFRPTERGGEQFSRTILVQAAATTPSVLAGFNSLRDLGWARLPYVCVRDELGNRWYANLLVPSARVRANRNLYFAEITVTDVQTAPTPAEF